MCDSDTPLCFVDFTWKFHHCKHSVPHCGTIKLALLTCLVALTVYPVDARPLHTNTTQRAVTTAHAAADLEPVGLQGRDLELHNSGIMLGQVGDAMDEFLRTRQQAQQRPLKRRALTLANVCRPTGEALCTSSRVC